MYQKRIIVLVVFFLGVTSFLLINRHFSSTEVTQNESGQSDATIATIHESILATEYQVNQVETAVYQAPNRMNGFRSNFSDQGVQLVPRLEDSASWSLDLSLTRVGDEFGMVDVSEAKISTVGNQISYDRDGIVEWYINNNRGLEQGFTLSEHPTAHASNMIHLDMVLDGSLTGQLVDDGTIEFVNGDGQTVITYDQLFAFDNNAKPLASTMSISASDDGTQTLRLSVDTQGAQFPVVIDPLASAANWYVETNQDDNLGFSVSSAGDVNNDGYDDVIVGANWYDNGADNAGAAFVYLGGSDGLSTGYVWVGMGNSANEEFGYAVSEAGDINADGFDDIIIGTLGSDSAYIYYGTDTGIDQSSEQILTEQAGSEFGSAVSYAGDVNDDGFSDVIVGAPVFVSGQGTIRGRAFVYYGSASGVSSSADWAAEGGIDGSLFGISVSNAGDVNDDQVDDIVIGDSFGNNNLEEVGSVFIFLGVNGEG
ncbi:MAG: integrin alpha, partial [Chloroflexota bacterium]